MEELLQYDHVDISYLGQPAIRDVSFSLHSGEILGIVGESGSGKSTLIKAAMGLLGAEGRVTRGEIRYKGKNLPDLPPKELRKLCGPELGYIFQSAGSSFCPIRTVGAQLLETMREHGKISKADFQAQALELLGKLGFADGEAVVQMIATTDYSGDLLFAFAGGKAARVPLSAYATKTNRKKLQKAYSAKSPLVQVLQIPAGTEQNLFFRTDGNRAVLADSSLIASKATRDTQGVQVVTLKAKHLVCEARILDEEEAAALKKYRVKTIPAAGGMAKDLPGTGQMKLV